MLLIITVLTIGLSLLFIFNGRVKQIIKSIFNKNLDKMEGDNTDAMLDQAKRETLRKDATINQAQAKIIGQMNILQSQKEELEQFVNEAKIKAKALKDLYLKTEDESKKTLAISVLDSIKDEQARLASLQATIDKLQPSYDNAQKMAQMARESNEKQRDEIENTRIEATSAKASEMIAESSTAFDPNNVDTGTSSILRRVKERNATSLGKLEVANLANASNIQMAEADKVLADAKAKDAFDNL